jgi:hypothetical protein
MPNFTDPYIIPVAIDGKQLIDPIIEAERRLGTLEDAAKASSTAINGAFRGSATQANTLDTKLQANVRAFGRLSAAVKLTSNDLKGLRFNTQGIDEKPIDRFIRFTQRAKNVFKEFVAGMKQGYQEAIAASKAHEQQTAKASKGVEREAGKQRSIFSSLKNYVLAYFGTQFFIGLGRQIIQATAQFQKFETVLTNALGSRSAAREAMDEIVDIAAKTPFQIDELTGSYVKLVNRGIKPTRAEIIALGDLAATTGKSFDQLVEALLDAQTGENERLKEFGIKAKKSGDQVTLSFKGVEKTVKATATGIKDAIIQFGLMPGVMGNMAGVSRTLGGQISNLGDAWSQLLKVMGDNGSGIFSRIVMGMTNMVSAAKGYIDLSVAEKLQGERTEINLLAGAIIDARDNQDLRNTAINNLMLRYPEFLKGLNAEKVSNEEIATRLLAVNKQYEQRIRLAAAVATQNAAQEAFQKNLNTIGKERLRIIQLANKLGIDTEGVDFEDEKSVRTLGVKLEVALDKIQNNQTLKQAASRAFQSLFGEGIVNTVGLNSAIDDLTESQKGLAGSLNDVKTASQGVNKAQEEQAQTNQKIINQLQTNIAQSKLDIAVGVIKPEDLEQTQKNIASWEAEIKRIKDGVIDFSKTVENEQKKPKTPITAADLKDIKKANDLLIKYTKELRDAQADQLTDDAEKQKANIRATLKNKQDEIDIELKALQTKKGTSAQEIAAIKKGNELKEELAKKAAIEIDKINRDTFEKQQELLAAATKESIDLQEDGLQKTIDQINFEADQKAKAIQKSLEKETNAKIIYQKKANLVLLGDDTQRKINAATLAAGQKKLKEQEEFLLAEVDLTVRYGDDSVNAVKAREVGKLQVQLEYAKKQLQLLIDTGKLATDQEVKNAEQLVTGLEKALGVAKGKKGKNNIWEFFGFGTKDKEDFIETIEDLSAIGDAINEVARMAAEAIQNQIDAKQAQIDQYDEQIDKLEESVEKEKELAEEGMANNLGTLEAEIAAKKALRDKEIADREALQKKMNAIRKAEIASDSVSQLSSLITASAKIFEAFSNIPFVGVPLAIAAIAAMFTAFGAAKITAFKNVGKTDKLEGGGEITGKRHSAGGQKYVAADGSGNVKELEEGEYVTNRKAARKHRRLLEAINSNKLDHLAANDYSLAEMLGNMGIRLADRTQDDAIQMHKNIVTHQTVLLSSGSSKLMEKHIQSIEGNVRYLADTKRDEPQIEYEDERVKRVKIGNLTRTIHKTKK